MGCNLLNSQDYELVDATISLYPTTCNNPKILSKFISRDFTSEEDKLRAIYSWIIQNVAYHPDEYKKFNYKFTNYRERNQKEENIRNKIINRTVKKGVAVCEGYAMLFERLCELQGIQNYLVRGDTKTNFNDIGRSFNRNHMWNVAYIDGKPFLFDPTWGAGKFHEKFIKEPSFFYYKTDPNLFIKSHYPDVFEDAFVSENISRNDFSNMPLLIKENLVLSDVETPKTGILYEDEYFGDIPFTIKNVSPKNISYSYGGEKISLEKFTIKDEVISFNIPLQIGVKILLIYFDDQPVLGYVIK
ncbi:MAG: transglutaminase/protease-like cytokinesis protein 3 [Flavobacteriaceae bacterium]|jgi:transglutaminase/protease-like cytokinesis protein 3